MNYPVGKRTKLKGHPGIYLYAGRGKADGKQPLCYYFTYKKSGYIKVGWNHEGFTVADAKERREAYIRTLRYGETPVDPAKMEVTFAQGATRYLEWLKEVKPQYHGRAASLLKIHINPVLGRQPIGAVKSTDVQRMLARMERRGYSQNSLASTLGYLRDIFRWLKTEGYTKEMPTDGIKAKRQQFVKDRYLEIYEIEAMLEFCQDQKPALDWLETRAQILLGVEMGLRVSEMFTPASVVQRGIPDYGLLWERIDWETGRVVIEGKGRKRRTLKMTSRVRQALRDLGPKKRGKVFVKAQTRRLHRIYRELGINDGLDPKNMEDRRSWCSMHTLRHTFGTYAAKQVGTKHGLTAVAKLMGHSTPYVTDVYSHLIKDADDQAMDEIGSFYEEAGEHGKVIPLRKAV